MIVSFLRHFVYLGPPKTASTSLHQWLSQPRLCDTRWNPARGDQHSAEVPIEAAGFFTFASVRNPYSRVVSLWRHHLADGSQGTPPVQQMSFAAFIAWLPDAPRFYGASQCQFIGGARLDAVVKIERIEEVFALPPFARLRHELPALPYVNRTWHDDWRKYYDLSLADAVRRRFAADFQRFGYSPAPARDHDGCTWAPTPRAAPGNC